MKFEKIAVELVLQKSGESATSEEFLETYPRLKKEGSFTILQQAAAVPAKKETLSLPRYSGVLYN